MTAHSSVPLTQQLQQACEQNLAAIAAAFEECWHEEVHLHCGAMRPCHREDLPTAPHYAIALEEEGRGLLVLLPSENVAGTKLELAAAHRIYALAESLRLLLSPKVTGWPDLRVGLIQNITKRLQSQEHVRPLNRFDLRFRAQARVLHVPLLAPLEHPCRLLARKSAQQQRPAKLDRLDFEATVVLASQRVALHQLAQLRPGSLLELGDAGMPASLQVDGTAIAIGDAVTAADQVAFRVQQVPQTQAKPRVSIPSVRRTSGPATSETVAESEKP